jgi:hypothetical protein
MKITDLGKFSFYIGNPLEDEDVEVVATNEGITIDGEVDGKYDDNDIIDAHDLCNAIDDAILNCSLLTQEEKDELGTYLGADYDIENWWEKNYG